MKIKVSNMYSAKGNATPNQFIIEAGAHTYFQSYQTIIARKGPKGTVLDRDSWDYSVTTGRYRNIFLGEGLAGLMGTRRRRR